MIMIMTIVGTDTTCIHLFTHFAGATAMQWGGLSAALAFAQQSASLACIDVIQEVITIESPPVSLHGEHRFDFKFPSNAFYVQAVDYESVLTS